MVFIWFLIVIVMLVIVFYTAGILTAKWRLHQAARRYNNGKVMSDKDFKFALGILWADGGSDQDKATYLLWHALMVDTPRAMTAFFPCRVRLTLDDLYPRDVRRGELDERKSLIAIADKRALIESQLRDKTNLVHAFRLTCN